MKIDLLKALKDQGVQIEEGQDVVLNELSKAIEESLKTQGTTFEKALQDALKERLGEAEKDDAGNVVSMMTQLKNIAEQVDKLSTNRLSKMTAKGKYQLRKLVKDNHKEIVQAIKDKKELKFEFNAILKVAAMHMTDNDTVSNADGVDFPATDNFEIDNEIAVIRLPENFILNAIPNNLVGKVPAQRFRKEQQTTQGAVAVTAEGAVKPLVQYIFVRTVTTRSKYAGRIEWTEEFEMDFEMLFRDIVRLFEQDVIRAWQDGILASMISEASSYVSSTLDDTLVAPDNGLAIVATQSQIQALNYNPDTVVMNPADLVATLFQQNADGDLKAAPYINTSTNTINGMRLFASNKMDQGDALVGDSRVYQETHSGFILRTGQYGNQLIENEYTAIGEVFSLLSIAEIDKVAWVSIDLAAVKAALLEPEPSE